MTRRHSSHYRGTMPVLLLLYYSSCHALAVACAIFAFVRQGLVAGGSVAPDEARPSRDIRFAILVAFLALGTVGMTFGYFQSQGAKPDMGVITACSWLSLFGMAGSIFAVPFFAASFRLSRGDFPGHESVSMPRAVKVFGALSLVGIPLTPLIIGSFEIAYRTLLRTIGAAFLAACFLACVVWSILRILSALKPLRESAGRSIEAWRWSWILKAVIGLGVFFCPLTVANDLFFLPQTLWGIRLPAILPLAAACIGSAHLIGSLAAGLRLQRTAALPAAADATQSSPARREPEWSMAGLTPREMEVARLLVSGYSYRGIAARLRIGAATVKTHILRVYDKTGAGNKLELLLFSDR